MYTGRTLDEAVRKWHRDVLDGPMIVLGRTLGIDLYDGPSNCRWIPDGKNPGRWYRDRQRDRVHFVNPAPVQKIVRRIHDIIPDGELEQDLAIADTAGPNDYDSEETLGWKVGRSATHTESTSMTHGWSVTITNGIEVGGEASQAKWKTEVALGAHGEYSKAKASDKEKSIDASKSTKIDLPKGDIARLLQTVETGKGIAKVEDFIILDPQFKVIDYKRRIRGIDKRLNSHAGYSSYKKTKSRVHWECTGAYDLMTAFEGTNPRYPGIAGRDYYRNKRAVRDAIDWMMNEDNRTIKVNSEAHYDVSIFSNSRVQRLGEDGAIREDAAV